MRLTSALLILAFSSSAYGAVTITSPAFDTVTTTRNITVRGTAGSSDGNTIKVTAAGTTYTATVSAGTWQVNSVRLANGFNRVRARATASGADTWVAVSFANLVNRGEQRVTITWDSDTADMLKDIARNTLTPDPSAAELDRFVIDVRAGVEAVVRRAYDGVAKIRLVNATSAGVQRIRIRTLNSGSFGVSPSDCGNSIPAHTNSSRVNLGTYAASWRNLRNWRPMRDTDTIDVRIRDVSEALGRTAAHEFGHSLGMVVCTWMNGCQGGHNCPRFDNDNPPINRFDNGFFIMDPGEDTLRRARIAEPVAARRTTPRTPAVLNVRNRSYLGIIHPLP